LSCWGWDCGGGGGGGGVCVQNWPEGKRNQPAAQKKTWSCHKKPAEARGNAKGALNKKRGAQKKKKQSSRPTSKRRKKQCLLEAKPAKQPDETLSGREERPEAKAGDPGHERPRRAYISEKDAWSSGRNPEGNVETRGKGGDTHEDDQSWGKHVRNGKGKNHKVRKAGT